MNIVCESAITGVLFELEGRIVTVYAVSDRKNIYR